MNKTIKYLSNKQLDKIHDQFFYNKFYYEYRSKSLFVDKNYSVSKKKRNDYYANAVFFIEFICESIIKGKPAIFKKQELLNWFENLNHYEICSLLQFLRKRHNPISFNHIVNGDFYVFYLKKEWFDFNEN